MALPSPTSLPGGWAFPIYIGHRRRLLPTDELFQDGSYEHDATTHTAARITARNADLHEAQEQSLVRDYRYLVPKYECIKCRALLPTAHLLDLHIAEVHDSFFAAQAARKLPVFACLVESCTRKFSTVEQRKQHLVEFHKFPRGYNLERMHLRRKKGQVRPLPEYRKPAPKQQSHAAEPAKLSSPSSFTATATQPEHLCTKPPTETATSMDEDLVEGMSRLRMSATLSAVPRSVAFGRRRGGFMPGLVNGRASGGGRSGAGGGGGMNKAGNKGAEESMPQS